MAGKKTSAKDVAAELVGARINAWLPVDYGLPQTIDDAEALFGADIYDRMLTNPDLQGLYNGLRAAILEQGWMISPAVPKPLHGADAGEIAEYEMASEIAKFVECQIKSLGFYGGRSFYSVLWEALGCLSKGHILAEVTYQLIQSGEWKGLLGLKSVKTKPRANYALVVDAYNNFLGVTARQPGRQFVVRVGYLGDASEVPSFVGRDKFLLFNWDLRDDDPRGTSLLRGCYRPWQKDQLTDPESVKYAASFGGGRILVVRGEQGSANAGKAGDETNEAVLKKAQSWGPNSALVLEHGATAQVVMPETDTKIFENLQTRIQKQFALALTTSIRAFLEAEHGSKADSYQGDKLLDAFIGAVHEHIEPIVAAQLIRPLVALNFGEDAVSRYMPIFSLRAGGDDNFATNAGAVSSLMASGAVTKPMLPGVVRDKLGLEYEPEEGAPMDAGPGDTEVENDDGE